MERKRFVDASDYQLLYDQGLIDKQIAYRLGRKISAVKMFRKRRGLPPNFRRVKKS